MDLFRPYVEFAVQYRYRGDSIWSFAVDPRSESPYDQAIFDTEEEAREVLDILLRTGDSRFENRVVKRSIIEEALV